MYFSNITANGTEALMGAIGSMTNLTRLQLGLEFNYIGDDGGVRNRPKIRFTLQKASRSSRN